HVRVGAAPAAAALLGDLHHRAAVLLGTVVIGDPRNARGLGGGQEAAGELAGRALVGHVQRTADRVMLGLAPLVVLRSQEVGAHVVPAPARAALRLPEVVVER